MICSTGIEGGSCVMVPESLCAFAAGAGDAAGCGGGGAGCLVSEAGEGGSGPCCWAAIEEASTGAARRNAAAIWLCSLVVRNLNSLAIFLRLLASGQLVIGPFGPTMLHANIGAHFNYRAFRGGLQTAREKSSQRFQDFDFATAAQHFHGDTLVMAMNQEVDAGVEQL